MSDTLEVFRTFVKKLLILNRKRRRRNELFGFFFPFSSEKFLDQSCEREQKNKKFETKRTFSLRHSLILKL